MLYPLVEAGMGKAQERVARLFGIVSLLQSGGGWSSTALAERFSVSRTRIFNDIRVLREVGVPVLRTKGGYEIGEGFFLPPMDLSESEAASLVLPSGFLLDHRDDGSPEARAKDKILASMSEETRRKTRRLLRHAKVEVPPDGTRRWVLDELRTALVEQRRVAITCPLYPGDVGARFEFDPYGLAYHKNAWHVVGYSLAHSESRKFHVAELVAVEPTPLHFPEPEGFSIDEFLK